MKKIISIIYDSVTRIAKHILRAAVLLIVFLVKLVKKFFKTILGILKLLLKAMHQVASDNGMAMVFTIGFLVYILWNNAQPQIKVSVGAGFLTILLLIINAIVVAVFGHISAQALNLNRKKARPLYQSASLAEGTCFSAIVFAVITIFGAQFPVDAASQKVVDILTPFLLPAIFGYLVCLLLNRQNHLARWRIYNSELSKEQKRKYQFWITLRGQSSLILSYSLLLGVEFYVFEIYQSKMLTSLSIDGVP